MGAGAAGVKVVGPTDGDEVFLGSIGVRFLIDGAEAGQRLAFLEHPMSPRALAAPLHRHSREDEYSFVLEGRMGALLGEEVVEAGPGELVFKPRNQWHTFWNAGDEPCRILEIISPAGFEQYFRDLAAMGGPLKASPEQFAELVQRYGFEAWPETIPELLQRFGLRNGRAALGRLDALTRAGSPAKRGCALHNEGPCVGQRSRTSPYDGADTSDYETRSTRRGARRYMLRGRRRP
jgi:mannose-6-phosphate isomerase-like protein (cupin superfamily)